jgi:hypothetical protein
MTQDEVATLIATDADVARCYKWATECIATVVANENRAVSIFGRWAFKMDLSSAERAGLDFCRSVSRARADMTADGRINAGHAALLYLAAYDDALRGVTAPEGRDAAVLAAIKSGAGVD